MTTKAQDKIIELMKFGDYKISYFRGIGTRYKPSAEIIDDNHARVMNVSVATVRALRDKKLIREDKRDFTHTIYSLQN